jgi:hypothetical protein
VKPPPAAKTPAKPLAVDPAPVVKAAVAPAKPVKPAPAPRAPGLRAPGAFEAKVLTALKRHGGAAVSFSASPDHIKSAFKRCLTEGWATGTIDSGSITASGEKVLEKLNPEIRAFPAPTLRNRLNDALFRNPGARPASPVAAAAPEAVEDAAADEDDDDVPEVEDEEDVVGEEDPDVEKAA